MNLTAFRIQSEPQFQPFIGHPLDLSDQVVTYTAVLSSFAKKGHWQKAIACFDQMRQVGEGEAVGATCWNGLKVMIRSIFFKSLP